jgi:Mce-associated membrane protein
VTQDSDLQDPPPNQQHRVSARFRLTLLVVLLVVLVVATASVAYLGATRTVSSLGLNDTPDSTQTERDAVMAQAEQFMLRLNTYGPTLLEGDTMPKYRQLVEEVITPKFAVDFEKNVTAAETLVKQSGLARTATVYSTGVASLDADSATALVAGSFTQSYPKKPGSSDRVQTDPASFRVEVKLVKIKGKWLVDDFTPVTGDDDSASPTAVPSVLPSSSSAPSGQGSGAGSGKGAGKGSGSGNGSGRASPSSGATP